MPALRTLKKGVSSAAKRASNALKSLQKKVNKPRKPPPRTANAPTPWKAVRGEDLVDIGERMKEAFDWEHTPREFQERAVKAQLMRKDVVVHAGTGNGKTAIAAGPHAHPAAKGKVTLFVSPLIALQEEQVVTFEEEFKLSATAINSTRGGLTQERIQEIREGKYQVLIASPEMILSKVFITQLIRNREFASRLLSVVIDEAHVVSHWGAGFRKKYGTLGILRALLPRSTPFVAMSATLAPRVRDDVLKKLQYNDKYEDISLGNDRENVSIVVRAMQHPMNTYRDLDFLIPDNVQQPQDIKKTFIYADTLTVANDIEDRLYECCPEALRYTGFIRPYSAGFSVRYRKEVMELFRKGVVRVLICTDAAGMGCNIPDIDVVVQWKLPATVSTFVQRAGRAARGHGRKGLAVLLVERSVYDADLLQHMESAEDSGPDMPRKTRGVRQSTMYPKASKEYAVERGILRGGYDSTNDDSGDGKDIPLDHLAIDEGLYSFVQTGGCRRRVLTTVYKNSDPKPTVPCCDNCAPELLDKTRPSQVVPKKRNVGVKVGVPNMDVMTALNAWRVEIAKRDFATAFFTANGFFSDDLLELCSSVGPISDIDRLKIVLGEKWSWVDKYGEELLAKLTSLSIPPMKPKPTAASKRRAAAIAEAAASEQAESSNNASTTIHASNETATTSTPTATTTRVHHSGSGPSALSALETAVARGSSVVAAAGKRSRGHGGSSREEVEGERTSKKQKNASTTISAHINGINMGAINDRAATAQVPQPVAAPSQAHKNPYMHSMVLGLGTATGAATAPPAPPLPSYQQPMWYPAYGWWPQPPQAYQPHHGYFSQASGAASYQQMANANASWAQAPAPASSHQHNPRPPT